MRRYLSLCVAFVLLLGAASCADEGKKEAAAETPVEMHTAQNSLDYVGAYRGVLPCADCEGIDTEVIIMANGTFLRKSVYLGKGADDAPIERPGEYEWDETGNIIILKGVSNAPNKYFVSEGKIIQLDMEGNRITGELATNYILTKR